MAALNGTIDEWVQDDAGRWSRIGHPEDGTITTSMPFADYWQRRLDQEAAAISAGNLAAAFLGDITRQEFVSHLRADTPAQIETFVRGRLNVDGVTDLASAKLCLKRMETGFVTIMKVLALIARQ